MVIGVLLVSMALSSFLENMITIIRSSKRNLYRTQLRKILSSHEYFFPKKIKIINESKICQVQMRNTINEKKKEESAPFASPN